MLVKVPYLVHMDAVVNTVSGTVHRVEIHADTVHRDIELPVIEVDSDTPVEYPTVRQAIRIAESAEWPSWNND